MSVLDELLSSLGKDNEKTDFMDCEKEEAECVSTAKQVEVLKLFCQDHSFKVGDVVVANEFGKKRIKYPNEYRPGIITEVFHEPKIDDDGRVVHGSFAVMMKGGLIITFTEDFRYLKLAD